jgi:hypothetical protein
VFFLSVAQLIRFAFSIMDRASHTNEEFQSKLSVAKLQLIAFRVVQHPQRAQSQVASSTPTRSINAFQIRRFSTPHEHNFTVKIEKLADFMKPKCS